jgi:hypothetical protein
MKLISSDFNKNTGISTVILQNRNGRYTGTAKLHPEDKGSEIAGCLLAEKRAWIKYYKAELKRNKIQLQEATRLKKDIVSYDSFGFLCNAIHRIDVRINFLTKERKELAENLEQIQQSIKKSIEIRKTILEKIGQK